MAINPLEMLNAVGPTGRMTSADLTAAREKVERAKQEAQERQDAKRAQATAYAVAFLKIKEQLPEEHAQLVRYLEEIKKEQQVAPRDFVRSGELGQRLEIDVTYLAMMVGADAILEEVLNVFANAESFLKRQAENKQG